MSAESGPVLGFVKLDEIRVNPISLRSVNQKEQNFIELTDSIRSRGVINAISLRPAASGEDGKKYELVDGLQRFTASTIVGTGVLGQIGVIPAQVMNRSDFDALVDQVIGNAQRVETKPAEYSKHLRRILGMNPTWTVLQLANKLNKSPSWVDKQLSLFKLAESIQKIVDEGKMPLVNAYALAQLPEEEQMQWLERAQTSNTTEFVQQVDKRAKEIRDAARKGKSAEPEAFAPVSFLRNKREVEEAVGLKDGKIPESSDIALNLVRASGVAGRAKDKTAAAVEGFQLGIAFMLNLDPDSVKKQQEKWEAQKKSKEEQRIRASAEREEKKAKEAQERAAEAMKAAETAKAAAAALPPQPALV